MVDRSKEGNYQPPRKDYRSEYNDDSNYYTPYNKYVDFDEEEYQPDSYRGSRSNNQPSYDQGYVSNKPKYPYTDQEDFQPNSRYNRPDSDHRPNHDDYYDSGTRSSRGLQPPWKPYKESSYERDANRYDYEQEEEYEKPVYKDKKSYSYNNYRDKHENRNIGYGRDSNEYNSQHNGYEEPNDEDSNKNYGSSSKTYSRSSAHYRDKQYTKPYRYENDVGYRQPEKENYNSHNRYEGQYGSYRVESEYDDKPYAEEDNFSTKPYVGEDTYSAKPYAGKDTYSDKPYAGKDTYSDKPYVGEDTYSENYNWKPESYNRKLRVRHHGSQGSGAMDGGYSSFQPSYNPTKGEPNRPYDPSAWARWEGGETGPPARSRRRGARRRVPTGSNWDTEDWAGASGPSGAGDTSTTVTKSHIIHHYKPEDDKEEKSNSGDTSVIGAIKKHLLPLPPLPKLPWPFGARRMGMETGEEIYIDGVQEQREYPDSIQSILENLEGEGTSLSPQQSLPFLDEDDMYFPRNDGYTYHNNV